MVTDDFQNDPQIWLLACSRLLNSLNVLERGSVGAKEIEKADASITGMMLAGFAFENIFKEKYINDGGALYENGKLTNFKDHEYVKWCDDHGVTFQGWESRALDKAQFFCVAWGRYPTHNRHEKERNFESWGWADVSQIKNLIYRIKQEIELDAT